MAGKDYDLVVIGGGPGGYTAAARATSLGMKTALVERRDKLGGTCLLEGCIPTKELLETSRLFEDIAGSRERGISAGRASLDLAAALRRKDTVVQTLSKSIDSLMKKHKVRVFKGEAVLDGDGFVLVHEGTEVTRLNYGKLILACGSRPLELDVLPVDGQVVIGSSHALCLEEIPESLVVVGGGAVGLELGLVWSRLGARVTLVEMMSQVAPFADKQVARALERSLRGRGMTIKLRSRVLGVSKTKQGCELRVATPKGDETLECRMVLCAAGRAPNTSGSALADSGIELDEKGRVVVDDHLRTSRPNVFAVGDMVPGPMLAHKAELDGAVAADNAAGLDRRVDYSLVPSVVYTSPELAQVGMTSEQAESDGLEFVTGISSFRGNARALTSGDAEGLVKVIADKQSGKLLGVHMLGPHVSELAVAAAFAIKFGAGSKDVAETVFAHPTLSEAFRDACRAAGA